MNRTLEFPDRKIPIALALWVFAVFLVRWAMLNASGFANGLDGYAYAVQILSLERTGHLMMSDDSPVFAFLAALDIFFHDPVQVTKFASAAFGAALCAGVYYALRRFGSSANSGLLAAFLVGLSPTMAYLSVDYVKNLAALVVLLVAIGWLGSVSKRRSLDLGELVAAAVMVGIVWKMHRISAILLGIFTFVLFVQRFGRRRSFWVAFLLLTGGAVVVLSIRGGLSIHDLERFFPQLAIPSIGMFSDAFQRQLPGIVYVEVASTVVAAALLALGLRRMTPEFRALWCVAGVLVAPIWDVSSLDVGFRLAANSIPFLIVLAVGVSRSPSVRSIGWIGVAALALVTVTASVYRVEKDPPYALYRKVVRGIDLPEKALLIAHAGLNHYYTYTHNLKESMNFLPEYRVDPELLWRISYGITQDEYLEKIPGAFERGEVRPLAGLYVLVREDSFREFLALSDPQRVALVWNWRNPNEIRPRFLLEKNVP